MASIQAPFTAPTGSFPNVTIPLEPFKISHSQQEIDDLKTLLRLSPLGPTTYENSGAPEGKFGVSMEWMKSMKQAWLDYDWFEAERELNEYPHYVAEVKEEHFDGPNESNVHRVHFIGIPNTDPNAIPLVLLHGWPGCFIEFLQVVPYLLTAASPPISIIIPSLIGYTYSGKPPVDREFGYPGMCDVVDGLMRGLGYTNGYAVQGGDIGSFMARYLGVRHELAKAIHLNFSNIVTDIPPEVRALPLTEKEEAELARGAEFRESGRAYAIMHATRPSTIGFCLASSPIALLAWIGEKILSWTDETPSTSHILQWLTLYWLTQTYPTSVYPYRHGTHARPTPFKKAGESAHDFSRYPTGGYIEKPFGMSAFPKEILPVPKSWVEKTGDLVFYNEHDKGGHFAALEQPQLLAKDILDFLNVAWPKVQ